MRSDIYSLLVSGMRYFFVAAIVYILFRIVYHSVCEYNELRRVKNWLEKGYARHIEFLPPFDTNEEMIWRYPIIGWWEWMSRT